MPKKTAEQKDEILTLQEMAELLKLPRSTAYKLVQERAIPGKKVGRHWRFVRSDLLAFLRTHTPGA